MAAVIDGIVLDAEDVAKGAFRNYIAAREFRSPKDATFGPAIGDGATNDRAALAAADAAAASAGAAVYCSPGTYAVGADLTLAADWIFPPGARLKPNGFNITLEKSISTWGLYPIFDLSGGGAVLGTIGKTRVARAWAEWWGGIPDWKEVEGVSSYTTDNTAAINAAIAFMSGIGGGEAALGAGRFATLGTIVMRERVKLVGPAATGAWICGETAGMTMVRCYNDKNQVVLHPWLIDLTLYSKVAREGLDFSGFANGGVDRLTIILKGSGRVCSVGMGHTGSGPYYNKMDFGTLGGDNTLAESVGSIGILCRMGANGGSGGPNRNRFSLQHAAALAVVLDHEAGNGNEFEGNSMESTQVCNVRANRVPNMISGTSTGGNTSTTLKDTGRDFTNPNNIFPNYCAEITGGTGARQWRYLSSVAANVLTIDPARPWTVTPDETSDYRVTPTKLITGTAVGAGTLAQRLQDSTVNFVAEGVTVQTWQVRCAGQTRTVVGISTTTNPNDTLDLDYPWTTLPADGAPYSLVHSKTYSLSIPRVTGEGASGADFIYYMPGSKDVDIGDIYPSSLGTGKRVRDEAAPAKNRWPGTAAAYQFDGSVAAGTTTKLRPAEGSSSKRGGIPILESFALVYVTASCGGRTGGTATVKVRVDNAVVATLIFNADRIDQAIFAKETYDPILTGKNLSVEVLCDASWSAGSDIVSVSVNIVRAN